MVAGVDCPSLALRCLNDTPGSCYLVSQRVDGQLLPACYINFDAAENKAFIISIQSYVYFVLVLNELIQHSVVVC